MYAEKMVQFISFSRRLRMVLDQAISISSSCHNHYSSTFTNPSVLIDKYSYENAVIALNSLQTNASTIEKSIQKLHHEKCTHVQETEKYLQRSGISMNQLDQLSVIHVSGTKGKGSTCALTESILRSFGVRTGFFSSPHLTYVTERIRINGKPISKDKFTLHFWKVFDSLIRQKDHNDDMPPYFKFLTILSFHIFFAEKVDVAIVEVGIGGQYDCTNVIRNTKTVGITSLGLEHTNLLGNTLAAIAGQKAGIIKKESNAFTVSQPLECVSVLLTKAQDRNAKIHWVPEFRSYKWARKIIDNKIIFNSTQQMNASLAIQLSYDWLKNSRHPTSNNEFMKVLRSVKYENEMCLEVPEQVIIGLEECVWNGRFQIIQLGNIRLFIDGAHTMESLEICINWFKEQVKDRNSKKLLLFNTTGDRNSNQMLDFLHSRFKFDFALFSPNISTNSIDLKDTTSTTKPLNKCLNHLNYWNELHRNVISTTPPASSLINNYHHSKVFTCVNEVFEYINLTYKIDEEIDLLVTGSLYLVGATLLAIEKK